MKAKFNLQQKKAIKSNKTHLIILAGPGTGKTLTLTSKIQHLIKKHLCNPEDIIALTFTKKAAQEIQENLHKITDSKKVKAQTFHSLAYEIVKNDEKYSEGRIITENEVKTLINQILGKENIDTLTTAEAINSLNIKSDKTEIQKIKQNYLEYLKNNNLFDYNSILIDAETKLTNKPTLFNKIKFILVDEFQDTNPIQYKILRKINPNAKITVIGDPHQSIYKFRGATVNIFERFENDFPTSKKITLIKNYRSSQKIINASHALFPDSKKLISMCEYKKTPKVKIIKTYNEYSETKYIINKITEKIGGTDFSNTSKVVNLEDDKVDFADFAILYRTHHTGQTLKKKFNENHIPFQVIGSNSIFCKPHILEILNSLKKLANQENIIDLVAQIIKEKGLEESLNSEKLLDLDLLKSIIIKFDQQPVKNFLDYVEQLTHNNYYNPNVDKVSIMTIHASKGLEFRYVFIIGFENGIIPYLKKDVSINEEKRILYVGMTRAKIGLALLYSKSRFKKKQNISKFYKFFKKSNDIDLIEDPAIEKIESRIKRTHAKKSQQKLF